METRKLSSQSSAVLNAIRAISAQLVVIGHGISFTGVALSLHQPNFPWMQNIAVLVFFILSGCLITYSLLNKQQATSNKQYTYKHYFIDRFTRIYTTFIPAIIFVSLVDLLSKYINSSGYRYDEAFNIKTFVGNALMLQDFPFISFVTSFGSARPFWTLAIEWWIYIFVGAVFFIFKKDKVSWLDLVFLGLVSLVPLFNLFYGRGNGLFMYWIFGALVIFIWQADFLTKLSTCKKTIIFFLTIILAAVVVTKTMKEYEPVFALLLALAILLLIDLASRLNVPKWFDVSSSFFASYSYTLYLIHYSIFDFLTVKYGGGYFIFILGFVTANIIAAILGYFFDERGARYVRRKAYKYLKL